MENHIIEARIDIILWIDGQKTKTGDVISFVNSPEDILKNIENVTSIFRSKLIEMSKLKIKF